MEKGEKMSDKTSAPSTEKLEGSIIYNPCLDSWQAIRSDGKLMISTCSREVTQKAFPKYTVKQ